MHWQTQLSFMMASPVQTLPVQVQQGPPAVARAPHAMEVVADAAISGEDITTIVNTAHVICGANGAATAVVRLGQGVAAMRAA